MANLKSPATIKSNMRQLRKEVIESDDPIASRIAGAMESAVRWATERTTGWPSLAEQARIEAKLLRDELKQPHESGESSGEEEAE